VFFTDFSGILTNLAVIKIKQKSQAWWLMPVILAIWKSDMWRIVVQGQPKQKVHKHPTSTEETMVWWCTCHPSDGGKHERRVQV
jgi:hypothetical protein